MNEQINYLLFSNPFSQKIISTTKKILFKNVNGSSQSTVANTASAVAKEPAVMSLFQQGGKASSIFIRVAGLSGGIAVILGAYGAHSKFPVSEANRDNKAIFETANRYHLIHSAALICVPLVKRPFLTGTLMLTGITLFCGTCYYSSMTGDTRFNRLAPLGGMSLILAWMSMMFF